MSSDADAACVAMFLSPYLINENDLRDVLERYKRRQQHTRE
jgi:hypothetical protein